ncbi:MAG: MFS transporter [Pirellulales bacterium]
MPSTDASQPAPLTSNGKTLILATAFLGWMFAGTLMAITPLTSGSAIKEMIPATRVSQPAKPVGPSSESPVPAAIKDSAAAPPAAAAKKDPNSPEAIIGRWFAWFNAAFLLGGATGGFVFGWVGDRAGRTKGMAFSILCFTILSGVSYFVTSPWQLLVLRFLACMGVGGMWPNGIAIVSEAWAGVSRTFLAGLIGTAANVGIVMVGLLGLFFVVTPDNWRWLMLVATAPVVLGVFILFAVPESPRWLSGAAARQSAPPLAAEVFKPPLLGLTLVGICLGTIPLLGGWGSGNWLVPWSEQVGGKLDPDLKAWTLIARSTGGSIGSLLGGWVAGVLGRKRSYFLISFVSLAISEYIFLKLTPALRTEAGPWDFLLGLFGQGSPVTWSEVNWFSLWTFNLGVISGLFFGWLPLCLPELFPTRVRSTGAGVSFNFGRIASACGVLVAGQLIDYFAGDYGRVGSMMSMIYLLGMIVIWFAPDTTSTDLAA